MSMLINYDSTDMAFLFDKTHVHGYASPIYSLKGKKINEIKTV
jgi:hypothetical protein